MGDSWKVNDLLEFHGGKLDFSKKMLNITVRYGIEWYQQQFDVLLFYTVFKHGDCPLKLPEATCEKIPDYDIIPMC